MNPITIKPNRSVITVESLSKMVWWKEWICKVFKIEPQRDIYYSAKVYYSDNIRFSRGSILFAPQDNTKWLVYSYTGGLIVIKNLTPIKHKVKNINQLVLMGSALMEDCLD